MQSITRHLGRQLRFQPKLTRQYNTILPVFVSSPVYSDRSEPNIWVIKNETKRELLHGLKWEYGGQAEAMRDALKNKKWDITDSIKTVEYRDLTNGEKNWVRTQLEVQPSRSNKWDTKDKVLLGALLLFTPVICIMLSFLGEMWLEFLTFIYKSFVPR